MLFRCLGLLLVLLGNSMAGWSQQAPGARSLAGPWPRLRASGAQRPGNTLVFRPRLAMRYRWDVATAAWVLPQRETLTYDAQARVSSSITADSATALAYRRVQYTYDAAGHLVEELNQTGNGAPWLNELRTVSAYDAQGGLTEELTQRWSNGSWETTAGFRYQNTYSSGVLSEQVVQRFASGSFTNETRFQYTLTAGRWSGSVAQRWEAGGWVDEERVLDLNWHSWEARQPATYRIQSAQPGGHWADFQWLTFTYNAPGTTVSLAETALPGGGWQHLFRFTTLTDAQGNDLGYRQEDWDNGSWVVNTELRYLLQYDATNRLIRQVEQEYSVADARFINRQRTSYGSFQDIATAQAPAELAARLALYPVPVTGTAEVELTGLPDALAVPVQVRSLTGQLLWAATASARQGRLTTRLDLRGLAPGVYVLQLATPQGVVMRRFLRQ